MPKQKSTQDSCKSLIDNGLQQIKINRYSVTERAYLCDFLLLENTKKTAASRIKHNGITVCLDLLEVFEFEHVTAFLVDKNWNSLCCNHLQQKINRYGDVHGFVTV